MTQCKACNSNLYEMQPGNRGLFPKDYLAALDAGYCSVDCHKKGKWS